MEVQGVQSGCESMRVEAFVREHANAQVRRQVQAAELHVLELSYIEGGGVSKKKHTQLLSVIHSNEHDTFFFGCTFGCSNTSSVLHVRVHFYSAFVWQGEGEEEYFIFSFSPSTTFTLFLNIHSVFLKTTIGRHHLQSAKTTVLTYREVQLLSRAGGFAIVICHLIQRRRICGSGLLELNHLTCFLFHLMIVPVFALVLGLHGKVILPPWPATWLMNASTIIQPCNMSGYVMDSV